VNSINQVMTCVACGEKNFVKHFSLKDYFLTMEDFSLIRCVNCGLLYTQPFPEPGHINRYYDSQEYTSHTSASLTVKNVLYRIARRIALSYKLGLIKNYSDVGKILDVGAGSGDFLNYCRTKGWIVEGIEANTNARITAKEKFGLELHPSTNEYKPSSAKFDVITMWHALEHFPNPQDQIEFNRKHLNDDGLMLIALPDHESWDAFYYREFWAAYDAPRHLFHFTRKSVRLLVEKSGFKIVELRPMLLDAFYISLLSEKYAHGKTNYAKAFINGIRSNFAARNQRYSFSSYIYVLKMN